MIELVLSVLAVLVAGIALLLSWHCLMTVRRLEEEVEPLAYILRQLIAKAEKESE